MACAKLSVKDLKEVLHVESDDYYKGVSGKLALCVTSIRRLDGEYDGVTTYTESESECSAYCKEKCKKLEKASTYKGFPFMELEE